MIIIFKHTQIINLRPTKCLNLSFTIVFFAYYFQKYHISPIHFNLWPVGDASRFFGWNYSRTSCAKNVKRYIEWFIQSWQTIFSSLKAGNGHRQFTSGDTCCSQSWVYKGFLWRFFTVLTPASDMLFLRLRLFSGSENFRHF